MRLETMSANGWQVPEFDLDEIAVRKSKYVIIIPVINEGDRFQAQLRDMNNLGITQKFDTVIADGGSTDGSTDMSFLATNNVRALLTKKGPGKLSAQLRCAYAWALIEGYEGVITIDGNGKDDATEVLSFASLLDDGFGYLQASRFLKGGRSENTPLLRYFAIRFIHAPILSLAAGMWLTDTTQGFRGYSRAYLLDERTQPFRDIFVRYELLAYLTVRASQIGYSVREVPTTRIYPANEKAPTKISGIRPLLDLIFVLLKTLFRVYHPVRKTGSDL